MTLEYREMRSEEADAVAAMVQAIADGLGQKVKTGLTAARLNGARDLVDVVVACEKGALLGACLSLMTYSTWRGHRGIYVVDLFVAPEARGRNIGVELLQLAAKRGRAKGARFIKLEVDVSNEGAARFYDRMGFRRKDEDRLYILEQDEFETFAGGGRS